MADPSYRVEFFSIRKNVEVFAWRPRGLPDLLSAVSAHTLGPKVHLEKILNELLSNSLKHPFPENREGEISISMHKTGGDGVALIYCDNGIGLPEGLDIRKTKTLGFRLIKNLASAQLNGKLRIRKVNGAEFRLNFSGKEQ